MTIQNDVKKILADVVPVESIQGLVIKQNQIGFAIEVAASEGAGAEPIRKAAEEAVKQAFPDYKVTVVLTAHTKAPEGLSVRPSPSGKIDLPFVKHLVAVVSGKGGVGKSTTAVNLALAYAANGKRVGILDADIYGPSIPRLLNVGEKPQLNADKKLIPLENYGLKIMSMGFMIEQEAPLVWRGPMVMKAIRQMLGDVAWANAENPLDLIIIDMPPGTGDAQLTMAQNAPLSGAVIVSTPQDIALIDARKGVKMFEKVNIPILGMIENMSHYLCPNCGHEAHIFGHGGAEEEAKKLKIECLGQIPLTLEIRETSDAGNPIVQSQPDSEAAKLYRNIADRLREKLEERPSLQARL